MRKSIVVLGAIAAVCIGAATRRVTTQTPLPPGDVAAPAAASASTSANIAMPALTSEEQQMLSRRFSPERLAAIRGRLQVEAQRAVRDEAEQAFREPTAEEAAAIGGSPQSATSTEVTFANGGAALKADASSLNVVRATVGPNGTVVTHEGKGVRRDQ
jgi:hypothetical protein